MDVFSLIRMVTAMLCDELSDAAKNVTPATPAQRARFGALVEVCALMRDAMEQASAADAVTPKKRRAILLGVLDGLNDIDADARRTCNADRWKAYATEKVTRYTRGLLASLNMTKEAVA